MILLLKDVCQFINNANKNDLIGIIDMAQTRLLEIEEAEAKRQFKANVIAGEMNLDGIENEAL